MDFTGFYANPDEKPLDNLVSDGGFCGIFQTIGCIGDSLSSGELESKDAQGVVGYHDFYEYSWGQYIARTLKNKVFNFSRGGMTAKDFIEHFAGECGIFKRENLCQCYIIALGVNDLTRGYEIGNVDEISVANPYKDGCTSIMAYYAGIVRLIKVHQPDAKIFFMTIPFSDTKTPERIQREDELAQAIRAFSEKTSNTYVIDLRKYAPAFDKKFLDTFSLGHMTPAGYMIIAKMVMSYIDYIIRNNHKDFAQAGFIGTPYKYIKN